MPVASQGETWALYGENFGELLLKKIALMEQHRNDAPAIDPDFMWRVGPESPVKEGEYLRYWLFHCFCGSSGKLMTASSLVSYTENIFIRFVMANIT